MLGARGSPAPGSPVPAEDRRQEADAVAAEVVQQDGMPGMATDDADTAVVVAHRPVPVGSWNGYSGPAPKHEEERSRDKARGDRLRDTHGRRVAVAVHDVVLAFAVPREPPIKLQVGATAVADAEVVGDEFLGSQPARRDGLPGRDVQALAQSDALPGAPVLPLD